MNRLVKYLSVILKWRRLIFWNTLILTVVAAGISFILPQRFTAVAQILPPSDETDIFGLTSLLGGGASSGLGRLRTGMLGGSMASDLMVGILESRTVVENVAERCSIATYYRIRRSSREKAGKQLREMTRLSATSEGIVRVAAEARTPRLAAMVANAYVAELDSFLRHSNISRGRNMRIFIERRLAEVHSALLAAQESLQVFQQTNRVASVDDETKAAIDAYAKLESQLYVKQTELGALAEVASEDNPFAQGLKREISSFRAQLGQLEHGRGGAGFGVGFGVSFERLPSLAAAFAQRYREFRIQEESYAALYEQYEYARILEARNAPAVTVLDYAVPPERRSFPRRTVLMLVAALLGLVLGSGIAFVSEYFYTIRSTNPSEYEGWQDLWLGFRRVFRPGRDTHTE